MGRARGKGRIAAAVALAVLAPAALAACGGEEDGGSPRFVAGSDATGAPTGPARPAAGGSSAPGSGTAAGTVSFSVAPRADSTEVPVSAEITASAEGGEISAIELAEVGGGKVKGTMRDDGSAWVPNKPLKYGKRYAATVTATNGAGQPETTTTTFTTMTKPASWTGTGLYLFDGNTYGVAMPVVVEFHPGIAKKDRAKVQQRMFVRTDPPQPGTWHWVGNGSQAFYRAPEYWRPGTTLSVRIAVGGHPTGNGRFGDMDRSATAKIGRAFEMKVDNAGKKMSVYEGDRLVRTMPVSLGKPKTPSSSGTMVVMEKQVETVFDTLEELGPEEGYRTDIQFAQRLTWGGEFIHSAPWSVGDQGRRNVSHGCVNLSPGNARWLFERTMVGDPVTVSGTERRLANGNGWTAWNMTWQEFVQGSALPLPDELR